MNRLLTQIADLVHRKLTQPSRGGGVDAAATDATHQSGGSGGQQLIGKEVHPPVHFDFRVKRSGNPELDDDELPKVLVGGFETVSAARSQPMRASVASSRGSPQCSPLGSEPNLQAAQDGFLRRTEQAARRTV